LSRPSAKVATTAIEKGRTAAEVVSKAFPHPMELKFERVKYIKIHPNGILQ
jgi:hypothetical protein